MTVDTHPDVTFAAHVDSIQRGSGARFSLLPPENATGNYVKVVQRVPVKIVFDDLKQVEQYALGPGMSVVPTVKVDEPGRPSAAAAWSRRVALRVHVPIRCVGQGAAGAPDRPSPSPHQPLMSQTASPTAATTDWKPSVNPWLIAAAVMLATILEVLDTSVANVALPNIAGNLSASTG